MKKFIAMILTLLLMATLVACGNDSTSTTPSTTDEPIETTVAEPTESTDVTEPSITDPSEDIPSTVFPLPSAEKMLQQYQNEVKYRLERESYFTREEESYIDSHGYNAAYRCIQKFSYGELHTYYYPVVYRVGDDIVIAYSRGGYLYFEGEYDVTKELHQNYPIWQSVHAPHIAEEEEEVSTEGGTLVYNSISGSISFWEFGAKVSEYTVPAGSVYAGTSFWEGYIFRHESEVYAVGVNAGVKRIATNVQVVVLADYYAGSDDWSQPLFLMKDGSLKVYCSWYGNQEAPSDDPCHLKDIRYEGGYKE